MTNPDVAERTAKATAALTIVKELVDALAEVGLAPEMVSVGGSIPALMRFRASTRV